MAEPMKGSIAMLKVKSGEIGPLVPVYFWSKKSDCQGQSDADWKKTNLDLRHDSVEDVGGDIRDARRADEGTTGRIEYG